MLSESPSVIIKRKNIQPVLDYCLENRIECKISPRDMPEEWELEFTVSEIMQAVNLGMFLKENKLELAGWGAPVVQTNKTVLTSSSKPKSRKSNKENATIKSSETEELTSPVIFNHQVKNDEDLIFDDSKKTEEDLFR